jgi:uncharacterized Zn finger protein (UPF0148 family)
MADAAPATDWTCARCDMTASWSADSAHTERPPHWIEEDGELYCLSCRREMAAEESLAALPEDATRERRRQARSDARIEFEITRDPGREDNRIAKACHTSIVAVRKARERLGMVSGSGSPG